jgi:predicted enzyme related to lactoylglutathione lyase
MVQYVTVDSIDGAVAKATELGGEVVTPRTEVPGMGWYGVVRDSEGGEIGLWEETEQSPG